MRSVMKCSLLLIKYYSGRQSEKNDIRGQCSTNGGKDLDRFFGGKPLGKNTTWKTQVSMGE